LNILNLFLLILIFLVLYYFFKKISFLNENTTYSTHKNFGDTNKSPIIIGGSFLVIIVVFFFSNELIFLKLSLLSFYILGLLSDKNILQSPKIRITIQLLILFNLVFFSELEINNLESGFLNFILKNDLANLCFTIFCFAILVNGSNFIDGLNGLLSGYYLMIILSIFYLCFLNNDIIFIYKDELIILFISLFTFFIFNIFGKVYLGDGGSYLVATFIGFYLIEFILINADINISPYYIASILWYPAFENLFSISRRVLKKNNISSPDNKHLHQLVFLYLKSKNFIDTKNLNTFSSMVILLLNLPSFILSNLMSGYSQILLFIILTNITFYLLIYNFISKNLIRNK
jgi:UDP-N-acetylmuramyl pentapeptide phosphotransferase/UDP-N-acetylglucosamine-1-phosphate transferase